MPQEVKQGTSYMLAGFGSAMAAHFFAQVVASRTLGPELYGLYGLVIYSSALVSGLFDSGMSVAMATFTAERTARKSKKGISTIVIAGINIEVVLSLGFAIICLAFSRLIADNFFSGIRYLVFFFIAIVIVQGFSGMFLGVLIGLQELKFVAIIRVIQQGSLLLLMLILVEGFSLSLAPTLLVHALSMSFALLFSIYFIKVNIKRENIVELFEDSVMEKYRDLTFNLKAILKAATPVSIAAVGSSILQSSGPVIINYLSEDKPANQLGIFVILLTLGKVFDSIIFTISRSVFPFLVYWNVGGNLMKTKQYINWMTLLVLGGYLLLFLGSLITGTEIIYYIFGGNYKSAARYLPFALLVFCAISLGNIYKISLYSLKRPGIFLIVNFVAIFVLFLSLIAGGYLVSMKDLLYLIFFSMGLANVTVTLGAFMLYKTEMKKYAECHPVI